MALWTLARGLVRVWLLIVINIDLVWTIELLFLIKIIRVVFVGVFVHLDGRGWVETIYRAIELQRCLLLMMVDIRCVSAL